MGPAFRMTGALLGIGQAGVGEPHQRCVRLLDQVYLDADGKLLRRAPGVGDRRARHDPDMVGRPISPFSMAISPPW